MLQENRLMSATATSNATTTLDALKQHLATLDDIGSAAGVLGWDLETMMPPKGMALRARQMATLSEVAHGLGTDPKLGHWLTELEAAAKSLSPNDQALLRIVRRDYDRATKLPASLVRAQSEVTGQAHPIWLEARKTNNFALFAPVLKQIVDLCRQEAECLGYEGSPYNALLDLYEPGLTTGQLEPLFDTLKQALVPLVKVIAASPAPLDAFLSQTGSIDQQKAFNRVVIEAMGFDLQAGRIDTAPHPFCSGNGPGDVRLTNRYFEQDWASSIFSAMHEAGHGLYEQGSPQAWAGTPLCGGTSLGIHESQSRLWENLVGRSEGFWQHFYPILQAHHPDVLASVSVADFVRAINRVRPSLIRVEADEVTYNLHIMMRYTIEKALMEGTLAVDDVPAAWNEQSQQLLGLTPPDDGQGCLQDIHWSHGTLGYFPTYTLGNLYASQLYNRAVQVIPNLKESIAKGDLLPLREWLRQEIHAVGKTELPETICRRVTGEPLNPQYFIDHVWQKYGALYNLVIPAKI
jgi:carboxypeptidase Taq